MSKKSRGPLRWYGGKCELAPKLVPLIPEHQTYVEVFAGGAALFFEKPISPIEVINDLDSALVNFYRVLRDEKKFERFKRLARFMPYSREEHRFCLKTWEHCDDEVERAARWFVAVRQSFGGILGSGWSVEKSRSSKGMASTVSKWLSAIDRLLEVFERLQGVEIENLDFREVIRRFDRRECFFYLDPPYVPATRKAKQVYRCEMTTKDHEELVALLLTIKGKAMLSGYDHPLYGALECAGWKKHHFETKCSMAKKKKTSGEKGSESTSSDPRRRVETVWVRR